jgi:hypothetical protein
MRKYGKMRQNQISPTPWRKGGKYEDMLPKSPLVKGGFRKHGAVRESHVVARGENLHRPRINILRVLQNILLSS